MFESGVRRTLSINHASRFMLCMFIAAFCLPVVSLNAHAQEDAAGGTARSRGSVGARVRIEATTSLRWNKAPLDSSNGTSAYWLHASTAYGKGTTSGGFTIDMQPRLMGTISTIQVNGIPVEKFTAKQRLPDGKASVARLMGSCMYGGKTYKVQFDIVGDYKPIAAPGTKAKIVRGSIHVKMTDVASKTSFEGVGEQRSSVTIWLN